jgi:hypothetical protein
MFFALGRFSGGLMRSRNTFCGALGSGHDGRIEMDQPLRSSF